LGQGRELTPKWQIDFPHSLGLLYSSFTFFSGFKANSGEYKLMGLAPYGEPKYVDLIRRHLVDIKEDGSFRLDMDYFDYATGLKMTNERFSSLFGGPPRTPESPVTQREMDLAASIQTVTEEIVLKLGAAIHKDLHVDRLCIAGGVALNCVANGRLLREGQFDEIWIQPAAGDAGGAIAAALSVWHGHLGNPRAIDGKDTMQGAYLGPRFSDEQIIAYLDSVGATYEKCEEQALYSRLGQLLA